MIDVKPAAQPRPPEPAVVAEETPEAIQKTAFDRLTAALAIWRKR